MPKSSRAVKHAPMTVDEVRGLRELVFRFGGHGQAAEHDAVPLKLALQQLEHFEKAASALAAYHRTRHNAAGGRTSTMPAAEFELELGAVRQGCTEVVVGVGRPAEELKSPDQVAQMGAFCGLLHEATAYAHDGGIDQLSELVEDGDCVRAVAASFEKIGHLQSKLQVRIFNAQNEILYGEGRSRPLHLTAGPVAAEVAALPLDRTSFIGRLRTIGGQG